MVHDPPYRELVEAIMRQQKLGRSPVLVGISGPVSVGKSTTAAILEEVLGEFGVPAEPLCTDCFLLPNRVLAQRGLAMRKGYPETFDTDALAACLTRLRVGERPVQVPVYSHDVYDIVPATTVSVGDADVVLVEGVNALQAPAVRYVDLAVYVDAEEEHVRGWFVDRFLSLCAEADAGGAPFYGMFTGMSVEERRAVAEDAWDGINGPNLRDHIGPSRANATWVLRKAADHRVIALDAR